MTDLIRLPCKAEDGSVHVVVESVRGSSVKLAFEPKVGAFVFRRALPLGVTYPCDWGFIPSTSAPDGDPLDAMVLFDAPTAVGAVIPSRPIGVVHVTQREDDPKKKKPRIRNDRIIAVPTDAAAYEDIADLPGRVREGLERFFVLATLATSKHVEIEGWSGPSAAEKLIATAARRYASGKVPK